MKFYDGNTLLSTDNSAPYSYNWTNASLGTHTINAVATDNEGNTGEATTTIVVYIPQGPYNGNAHPIPGTIQLEEYDVGGNGNAYYDDTEGSETDVNFRIDEDVDIEVSKDTDGEYNLGYTTAGEWLEYTVDVTKPGVYDLDLRVACAETGRTVTITMDGDSIATDVAIPNTTGWQAWQTITISDVVLIPGQKVMRVTIGAEDFVNLNYATFRLTEEFVKGPYNGNMFLIPGRIEAENYDEGKEGLGYHEINANGNEGDADYRNDEVDIEATADIDGEYNLAYIRNEEWLEYTVNVQEVGDYQIDFRMASEMENSVFHLEVEGIDVIGPIEFDSTGGWQTWETITVENIPLEAGEQVIRVVFDSDYMNFNYMEFKSQLITGMNIYNEKSAEVFPNPFGSEGVHIITGSSSTYTLYDVTGKKLESGDFDSKLNVGRSLDAGIYFLSVQSDNQDRKVFKINRR